MITRYLIHFTFSLLLSLLLLACNSDNPNTNAVATNVVTASQPMPVAAPQPEEKERNENLPTIAEYASKDKSLAVFSDAFAKSGLAETLNSTGPYTVFIPSNKAFEALPDYVFKDLMKPENKDRLVEIINNHMVAGKLDTTSLQDGSKIKTLSSEQLEVSAQNKNVMINDATVKKENILCSNGVIHVIDKVLIPAKKI